MRRSSGRVFSFTFAYTSSLTRTTCERHLFTYSNRRHPVRSYLLLLRAVEKSYFYRCDMVMGEENVSSFRAKVNGKKI